jgi:short-subunit dehydrogenase
MGKPVCAIIGIGPKNGEAFARTFSDKGFALALLSRSTDFSESLAAELGDARAYACDAGDPASIEAAFSGIADDLGPVDVLIYNAGSGSWKTIEELSVADFTQAFNVNALGAMAASQQVIPGMKEKGAGNIVFIGATASIRGVPFTAGFAPAKAAQRILAQSMAKHLAPLGIHVSVIIIDGQIDDPGGKAATEGTKLDPRDIAAAAYNLTAQPRSAWSFEIDLRPMNEKW